jgi:hypothetical protein
MHTTKLAPRSGESNTNRGIRSRPNISPYKKNQLPFIFYSTPRIFLIFLKARNLTEQQKASRVTTRSIMATTVHVQGIGPQTSEKEVRDFFSFW